MSIIKTPSQKGKMSRGKGKRGERMIVKILKEHGWEARRGYQGRGGIEQPDIVSDFPFRIEVKYRESLNIFDVFKQMELDNPDKCGSLPNLVIFRKNGEPWRVSLSLEDFLKLVKH